MHIPSENFNNFHCSTFLYCSALFCSSNFFQGHCIAANSFCLRHSVFKSESRLTLGQRQKGKTSLWYINVKTLAETSCSSRIHYIIAATHLAAVQLALLQCTAGFNKGIDEVMSFNFTISSSLRKHLEMPFCNFIQMTLAVTATPPFHCIAARTSTLNNWSLCTGMNCDWLIAKENSEQDKKWLCNKTFHWIFQFVSPKNAQAPK